MPIERATDDLDRIAPPGSDVEVLGSHFGGERGPAEGPLWIREGGYLLFSDISNDRRMRWDPEDGFSVDKQGVNRHNGLTRDRQGRLLACEHDARRVTRVEADGSITVVANDYRGWRLNRPNDVVVRSDGSIFFTDPDTFQVDSELDLFGVYKVTPDLSRINLLVRDFVLPNGLAFSPDESVLYVADSRRGHVRAFDVEPHGRLALATDRVLAVLDRDGPGAPDGMKVDVEGNVYCTGPGGIYVIEPSGRILGRILTGDEPPSNVAWGGGDWKTLYYTTRHSLGRIRLNVPGVPV